MNNPPTAQVIIKVPSPFYGDAPKSFADRFKRTAPGVEVEGGALTTQPPSVTTQPPRTTLPGTTQPPATTEKPGVTTEPPKYAPGSELEKADKARRLRNNPQSKFPQSLTTKTTTTAGTTTVGTSSTTTAAPGKKGATTEGTTTEKPKKRARGYEQVPGLTEAAKALDSAAKALTAQAAKPTAPATQDDPDEGLDRSQKKVIAVLEVMETKFPDRYPKGFAANAKKVAKKIGEFKSEFIEKNADATEEEIEEAVVAFEEKSGVRYNDEDFEDARFDLANEPLRRKLEAQEKELERLRKSNKAQEIAPEITENAAIAAQEVAKELGVEALLKPDGTLDESKVDKFIADHEDPELAEAAADAIKRSESFAEATVRLFAGEPTKLADQVSDFCIGLEQNFSKQPDTSDDAGRTFITRATYDALPAEERAQLDNSQHPDHWILTPDVVITMANDHLIARAHKIAAAEKEKMKRRGYARGGTTQPPQVTTEPPDGNGKPDTVTSSAGGGGNGAGVKVGFKNFRDRLRGGVSSGGIGA